MTKVLELEMYDIFDDITKMEFEKDDDHILDIQSKALMLHSWTLPVPLAGMQAIIDTITKYGTPASTVQVICKVPIFSFIPMQTLAPLVAWCIDETGDVLMERCATLMTTKLTEKGDTKLTLEERRKDVIESCNDPTFEGRSELARFFIAFGKAYTMVRDERLRVGTELEGVRLALKEVSRIVLAQPVSTAEVVDAISTMCSVALRGTLEEAEVDGAFHRYA